MQGASFRDADLEGANFAGADLRGACLLAASFLGATFVCPNEASSGALLDVTTELAPAAWEQLTPPQQCYLRRQLENHD